ncbi:hypothetical protein OXX59_007181 [Metschnikowia pulcherrima]
MLIDFTIEIKIVLLCIRFDCDGSFYNKVSDTSLLAPHWTASGTPASLSGLPALMRSHGTPVWVRSVVAREQNILKHTASPSQMVRTTLAHIRLRIPEFLIFLLECSLDFL